MDTFFVLFVLLVGILFGFLESEQRHFVLWFTYHGGIQLLVGEEIIQVNIPNHCCFKEVHVFMGVVGIIPHEHVSRSTYQNRVYIDRTKQRRKQHTTVHTVDLWRVQCIIKRADPLRENNIARQAGIGNRTVTEFAFLQDVPKSIDLLVYHTFRLTLVSQKTIHDTGIQRFAKQLVNHRIFFIDIGGKEDTGIIKFCSVCHISQQTLVDAAYWKSTHPLA